MKIKSIFAALAVLATCVAAPAQDNPASPPVPVSPPVPASPPVPSSNTPPVEVTAPPLPEGRNVSYAPLIGPDAGPTNAPAADEEKTDVTFADVSLTDAITSLAVQAQQNIVFDPSLQIAPDGHPIPPPQVTVKWRNITAMQALRALLDNYGWQLVWDSRTKVGRVTKKDPAAKDPLIFTVVQLRYGSPTNLVKELQDNLSPGSAIIPDMRTHQLIIRTTEKELLGMEALITKLDTPTRQVLVEAKIVQTSKDISSAKGVDWTGTLQAQHVTFGNGLTQGTSTLGSAPGSNILGSLTSPGGSGIFGSAANPANVTSNVSTFTSSFSGNPSQGGGLSLNTARGFSPATAFLNADGVSAVLSFLNTDNDTKTIAFPRTVALDGVPTELAVVQNIPIFQQTQSAPAAGAAQGLATIQPTYNLSVQGTILNEVGVKLTVTPRIAGPTNVLLDLKPEISEQGATVTETLNGQPNQAPSFSRSRITTQAAVPSGYTLVLGGMDQDVVGKTYTKVPFFGDIPGLGYLFRSDSKTHSAQTILIFVTPTIIADNDYQLADSRFEKRKSPGAPAMNEPAWDTGEPYDWTKPKNRVSPDYQP
ncbi:MAG TPA: secretin N-terminal domain-containing protein [Verrucomicrobiae bacterium]|jgi:type II secretory pathway component GspD/PulD (secretin)